MRYLLSILIFASMYSMEDGLDDRLQFEEQPSPPPPRPLDVVGCRQQNSPPEVVEMQPQGAAQQAAAQARHAHIVFGRERKQFRLYPWPPLTYGRQELIKPSTVSALTARIKAQQEGSSTGK